MIKQAIYLTTAILLLGTVNNKVMSQNRPPQNPPASTISAVGMVRHVVLFKFKDNSTPAQIREVEQAFSALPKKINTIVGYEWGTNMSPENLAQGFTHCFLVTFRDAAGRDAYLPHPAHKEFGKVLGPHLDKVLVIDFVGQQAQ